jgi:quercetin dioxygenase-like cupin family protein
MKSPFLKYIETAPKKINPYMERRILTHSDQLMMVEVSLKQDGVIPMHNHIHEQMTHIISGVYEFEIDGKVMILSKGDTAHMPSNVFHRVICIESGTFIDVFNPTRKDFL